MLRKISLMIISTLLCVSVLTINVFDSTVLAEHTEKSIIESTLIEHYKTASAIGKRKDIINFKLETIITTQNAYDAIMNLQNTYPEGTPWNDNNYLQFFNQNTSYYVTLSGCSAWGHFCTEAAFGDVNGEYTLKRYDLNNGPIGNYSKAGNWIKQARGQFCYDSIRPGDLIRINNDGHTVVVLEKYDDYVIACEGNVNGGTIHWGRKMTKEQVLAGTYLQTRYPNPPIMEPASTTSTGIRISWEADDDATEYAIWKRVKDGEWEKLGTVRENYYDDPNVKKKEYEYRIQSYIPGISWSHYSDSVFATFNPDCAAHVWSEWKQTKAPTCTEPGVEIRECSVCREEETRTVEALGHAWSVWKFDGEGDKTHSHICEYDGKHKETEPCIFDEGVEKDGTIVYTCSVCGGSYANKIAAIESITRLAGKNRFGTSMAIADTMLVNGRKEKHKEIILANGDNFADALAGSYLAAVKEAPIIITRSGKESEINKYIKENLSENGTVYVLGGTNAVKENDLKGLDNLKIKRLQGSNRYGTNLAILREARIEGNIILVATGQNYADSLSASATGLPMLLVKDSLNDEQKKFLKENAGKKFVILGGNNAVTKGIESELKKYGEVERLSGDNRNQTSVLIADRFFNRAKYAVIAYSQNFPDGLCGGPLANQIGAPLLLVREDRTFLDEEYTARYGISNGYALGGTDVLSDTAVRKVFGTVDSTPITVIER